MAPRTPSDDKAKQGAGVPSNGNNVNGSSSHEPSAPSPTSSSSVNDHLAQALRDLARGEQTASALEANLSNLESKLDAILASYGVSAADLDALDAQEEEARKKERKDGGGDGDGDGEGKGAGGETSKGEKEGA